MEQVIILIYTVFSSSHPCIFLCTQHHDLEFLQLHSLHLPTSASVFPLVVTSGTLDSRIILRPLLSSTPPQDGLFHSFPQSHPNPVNSQILSFLSPSLLVISHVDLKHPISTVNTISISAFSNQFLILYVTARTVLLRTFLSRLLLTSFYFSRQNSMPLLPSSNSTTDFLTHSSERIMTTLLWDYEVSNILQSA